jgi:hypothetical protein
MVPGAIPVTTPSALTVATAGLLVDHVTARPVRTLPLPSLNATWKVRLLPIGTHVGNGVGGMSTMDATGTRLTVSSEDAPVAPSLAAEIVTLPGAMAVTVALVPFPLAVAILGLLDVQVTVRPVKTTPPASRSVATA